MRKFYLLFAALFAGSVVASAGVKNLYKQDFESVSTPQDAGWTSPNLAGNMSIFSDAEGSAFQFSLGANNNRNAVLDFNYGQAEGETIYGEGVSNYTISFIWGLVKNPESTGNAANVQFSSEIAVLTPSVATSDVEGWKITTGINNGQYAANDSLRLFALTQLKGAYSDTNEYWADNTDNSNYAFDFYINGDQNQTVTLEQGGWYQITINVDTEARTTEYEIFSLIENDVIATGTSTIPEYASVYANKLNVLLGRYNSVAQIDDVKIQQEMEGDYANTPTVALTGVENAKRTYTIFFEEGEILNVKKTDGTTDTAVESPYIFETETSGTLEVWTESGSAKSEVVAMDVVAETIQLPAAKIEITKVNSGYVKSLLMTADGSSVLTQPNITLTWEYSNGDASTGEVASGAVYEATEKGTLTVTTHAYGFGETTVSFENNTEFAVDAEVDFQHLDEAKLAELGFSEIDVLDSETTSGESNWTARKRLWLGIENGGTDDAGNPTYDTQVVYGPSSVEGAEPIRRFRLPGSTLTEEKARTMFAPAYLWWNGLESTTKGADEPDAAGVVGGTVNPKINYGIGLCYSGVVGDTETYDPQGRGYGNILVQSVPIGVDGLTDDDYYIVYLICDYGSTSQHPIYPEGTSVKDAIAQYKASNIGTATANANQQINGAAASNGQILVLRGTDVFGLYRVDTAITKIEVFKSTGESGIQEIGKAIVSDANAPIYNLNGERVSTLKKGVYVKQGKKFIVR